MPYGHAGAVQEPPGRFLRGGKSVRMQGEHLPHAKETPPHRQRPGRPIPRGEKASMAVTTHSAAYPPQGKEGIRESLLQARKRGFPHAGKTGDVVSKRPADLASHARRQENRNFSGRRYRRGRRLVTCRALLLLCPATLAAHPGTKKPKTPTRPMRGAFLHVSRRIRKKNGRKPASFTMHRALYAKRRCAAQRSFRFSSASAAQSSGLPCLLLPALKNAPQGRHSFF